MLQRHSSDLSLTLTERPCCPKCQICMMLVDVARSVTGPDLRTFECPKCDVDYKALAEDPMKTKKAVGWLKGEQSRPD
jgi:hypothetical protein